MIRFVTMWALAAGIAMAPVAAQAAAPWPVVETADLDLTRIAHVAELDRRLTVAARTACETGSTEAAQRCRAEARLAVDAERDRLVAAAGTVQLRADASVSAVAGDVAFRGQLLSDTVVGAVQAALR